ncbi:MAG: DUF2116 family Zn-ribbon domain-containing protein [Bacteroidales bacterium]|nr:DUF2116 family Zn-ribbon domain-containing protein [Bacteroidales bacterium]
MKGRKCPVCGKEVNGRSDKRFCSDECRIFYNNSLGRTRRARNRKQLGAIRSNIMELERADAKFMLKILSWISKVFRVISSIFKFRNERE